MNLLRRTYLHCWSTAFFFLLYLFIWFQRHIYRRYLKIQHCKILKTIEFSKLKKLIKVRDESRQDWIFLNLGPTIEFHGHWPLFSLFTPNDINFSLNERRLKFLPWASKSLLQDPRKQIAFMVMTLKPKFKRKTFLIEKFKAKTWQNEKFCSFLFYYFIRFLAI